MATQLLSDHKIDPYGDNNEETKAGSLEPLRSRETSGSPSHRTALERFFDSFFQPANIKWMLIVGASIVLGSSLMLVTKQWSDWQAAIKFLAMLCYTAAIWGFAEFADRRLGLKSTGNVLRGLSLLLMPILLLALSWVSSQTSTTGLPIYVEVAVLFLPAVALLNAAGKRILDHFLRGQQLTYLVCYVLLAMAGILPRAADPWLAMFYLAAFWTVLTVGAIKVNRHVFWLTEEHRLPRVFGFFPILLLSAQFLMLCGTKVLFVAPPQWLGLATVLLAATILGTTRSIASVFRARTGDLVRPLPWSIALPLFLGVLLAFTGVCVSFQGFHFVGPTTYAVVPTALVATFLMFFVAYDTRHWAFTALALVLLTVAYQCTPTLIADWVQMLKAGAASAVREDKLPFSFYGITYLPLLATLTGFAAWLTKVRRTDMSVPIQVFVTAMASLLWCSSLFSIKAAFIVAAINGVSFLMYAIAFRDRRYAVGTLLAVVLMSATLFPFVNAMFATDFGINTIAISLISIALCFYSTRLIDRAIERIPLKKSAMNLLFVDPHNRPIAVANQLGLAMLVGLGCLRFVSMSLNVMDFSDSSTICIDLLLLIGFSWITYRNLHYLAGFATVLLAATNVICFAIHLQWTLGEIMGVATIVATSVSMVGLLLSQWTHNGTSTNAMRNQFGLDLIRFRFVPSRLSPVGFFDRFAHWVRCNSIVLTDVATCSAVALGLMVYAPDTVISNWNWAVGSGPRLAATFLMGWLIASTLLIRSRWAAGALAAIAPLYASLAVLPFVPNLFAEQWQPVVWVGVASLICILCHFYATTEFAVACFTSRIWLCVIALVALVYLSVPIRIAGAVALGALLIARGNITLRGERMFVAILCNVHILLWVANLAGAHGWVFQNYRYPALLNIAAALLPAFAISMLVSDTLFRKINVLGSEWWSVNLRILAAIHFAIVCIGPIASLGSQTLVLVAVAIVALCEFMVATRSNSQLRAWSTIGTVGLAVVWGWDQGWLHLGNGWSQLTLVGLSAACLWTTGLVRSHVRLNCFANPFAVIGLVLPGLVSVLSIAMEMAASVTAFHSVIRTTTHSVNYLALFAAAAVYFFHGLENGKKGYFILSTVILNFGLALVWFTNGFSDPQFYCVPIGLSILWIVELLKKELPSGSNDPLRYVGALVILVSPVYGICGSGWFHLFSLMVLSVLVILLAIGLRIRVLMYTGTAFLFADIAGILIRSTMDNPLMLWVGGIALGGGVIALAAFCENHRENLLAKIRMLTAELATWN